jgi:hypothetical protein
MFSGFLLHPPDTEWSRLIEISVVRHALAHANGRLEDVERGKRERLQELVPKEPRLLIREGYLIVSRKYARDALNFITQLIDDLGQRVEREIKSTH